MTIKIYKDMDSEEIPIQIRQMASPTRTPNPRGPESKFEPPRRSPVNQDDLLLGPDNVYVSESFIKSPDARRVWARKGVQVYRMPDNPVEQVGITKVGQTFWENPQRLARYYNAAKTLPPGSNLPSWLDMDAVNTGYEYMRQINGDRPWYLWEPLHDDDPVREFFQSIPTPPPEAMPYPEARQFYGQMTRPPREDYLVIPIKEAEQYFDPSVMAAFTRQGDNLIVPAGFFESYKPEMVTVGGQEIPKNLYDQLPGWQKAVLAASPWVGMAIGGIGGALAGGSIAGPLGAIGGLVAGAGLAKTGEINETAMQIMNLLDIPALEGERAIAFLGQIVSSIQDPERYGSLAEILGNLEASWKAGTVLYESAGFGDQIYDPETGMTTVINRQIGEPEPTTWTTDAIPSSLVITETRRRLIEGKESPEEIYQDIRSRFGFAGEVRDLIGHMFLDPLNYSGDVLNAAGYKIAKTAGNKPLAESFQARSQVATIAENFRRGLAGQTLLNTPNPAANDVIDALRLYGSKLRRMPVDEAIQFGAVSRWIAGLDKAGNMKHLKKGDRVSLFDYLRGLTPQARAHEVLAQAIDGLQVLLRDETDPMKMVAHVMRIAGETPEFVVKALEDSPLPRWFQSPEGQPVSLALRDLVPKAREMGDVWKVTRPQATILQRVADALGEDVYDVMSAYHKATPEEAESLYRAFLQSLEKRAATDKTAAALLDALRKDQGLTGLSGMKLKEYAGLFMGKDGAPFSVSEFQAKLFHMLAEGMEGWTVKWFGVRPAHWAVRIGDLVKRAQGLVLLGINPTYLINNAINNLVTLGWDGILGLSSAKSRMRFLRQIGVKPVRLRSGANAAEIGSVAFTAQDVGGYELGRQIKSASRAGGILTSLADFFRGTDRFAIFANMSQKFEMWSSEIAMVTAMRRYWDNFWVEGRAISKMPEDLALALDAYDKGLSRRVMKAIERGKSKEEIERTIFKDLGKFSIRDVLTREEKDLLSHIPDLIDDLDEAISKAEGPNDIRAAFANARTRVQQEITGQIHRNMTRITQEARNTVEIEGVQGMLDIFDLHIQERHDFWLAHFERMERVAAEAERLSGPARRAVWQNALDEADRDWKAFNEIEAAKWLGVFDAFVGQDNPVYGEALDLLTGMQTNWNAYYAQRRLLMEAFFELADEAPPSPARRAVLIARIPGAEKLGERELTSKRLWQLVNEVENQEYIRAILTEDGLQAELDARFASLYAEQFPDDPQAEAKALAWRNAIRSVRQRMAVTMVLYRTGGAVPPDLEDWMRALPPEVTQAVAELTRGIPPYMMKREQRDEIARRFYQEIYTPYIREMLDASNNNPPGRPLSPEPEGPAGPEQPATKPPAPEPAPEQPAAETTPETTAAQESARRQTPPEKADLSMPAVDAVLKTLTPEQEAAEIARANRQGVFKIAAEHGIGSVDAGGQKHILNILKQYYRVDSIDQVTPEMARAAFEKRALFKGAVDLEAQQRLDQRIREHRAETIRRQQQEFALAAPKRFTRDAVYREAEQVLGEEQAAAVMEIYDRIARTWADENNRTVDEFYEHLIITRGGETGGSGIAQQDLWAIPKQEITSANTSINKGKLPATFKQVDWKPGTRNADIGGGRFDNATEYLAKLGVENVIYDPFNRGRAHNVDAVAKIRDGQSDTATVNNVLNVIKEPHNRDLVIRQAANAIKPDGEAFFLVYEGDKSGIGRQTSAGWQENRPAASYETEILQHFGEVKRRGNLLIATKPVKTVEGLAQLPPAEGVRLRLENAANALRKALRENGFTEPTIDEILAMKARPEAHLDIYDIGRPYWNEMYEYVEAARANRWLEIYGKPFDYDQYRELVGRNFLFQINKGLTRFLEDGRALIHAYESADVSTFVHEIAHVWLPLMGERDIRTVENWLRAEYGLDLPNGWQYGTKDFVQAKELFARGFERYLAEGRAPVPSLRRVFENFKRWLIDIYKTITGSDIDIKLNDEIIGLFDRWMRGDTAAPEPARSVDWKEMVLDEIGLPFEEVKRAVWTSPVAGIGNKLAFDKAIESLAGQEFYVIAADMRGLKATNDLMGHSAGDMLLRVAGIVMEDLLPERAFHLHGDEYAGIVVGSRAEADRIAAELQSRIQRVILEIEQNGERRYVAGYGMHIGVGEDYATADAASNAARDLLAAQAAAPGADPRLATRPTAIEDSDLARRLDAGSTVYANRKGVVDITEEVREAIERARTVSDSPPTETIENPDALAGYMRENDLVAVDQDGTVYTPEQVEAAPRPEFEPEPEPSRPAALETEMPPAAPPETEMQASEPYVPQIGDLVEYEGQQYEVGYYRQGAGVVRLQDPVTHEGSVRATPSELRLIRREPETPAAPPEPRSQATPETEMPAERRPYKEIRTNKEKEGLEVVFDGVPSDEIKIQLHKSGFRWSRFKKWWYAKDTPARRKALRDLFGWEENATAMPDQNRWPTFEEWKVQTGLRDEHRSEYSLMIRKAVRDGDLGFDEAAELVGEEVAGAGMFDRYTQINEELARLTLRQYLDAAIPWAKYSREIENPREYFTKWHRSIVEGIFKYHPEKIPDDVLNDYPDLRIFRDLTKEPPTQAAPTNPPTQEAPGLFNAPEGQFSLFGEADAGFGLIAQRAKDETFSPETKQQQGLFDTSEYLQPAVKGARQAEDSGAGPLFEQAAEPETPRPAAPEMEMPTSTEPLKPLDVFEHNGFRYQLLDPLFVGDVRAKDLSSSYPLIRKWGGPEDFERTTGLKLSDAFRNIEDPEELRLAARQMLIDYINADPDISRHELPDVFEYRDIPNYGRVPLASLIQRVGVDAVKSLLEEAWDVTHQPPVDVPITIQPSGTRDFINFLAQEDPTFATQRDFEELAQRMMGLDMNDEKNLNQAYDALEGAFNLRARRLRESFADAPLDSRLRSLQKLEDSLLRARRTFSKMELQQFSTPLTISEAAGEAADVRPGDIIVEPTAGTGNLIDRFWNRSDVVIRTNEIDQGRLNVLEALGYEPTSLDVLRPEWILDGNLKQRPPMGTVIIANPPWGAYNTGRYGPAPTMPVQLNDVSERFTDLILRRLPEGGRFVGVMPTNWVYVRDRITGELKVGKTAFLKHLESQYTVVALIESPKGSYKARATNVDSLLVVIDKVKPMTDRSAKLPNKPIEAYGDNAPKDWGEYAQLILKLKEGGSHARRPEDIQRALSAVRQSLDDEINARRPASGPDATGLVDPNARLGKPESNPVRIGHPVNPRDFGTEPTVRPEPTRAGAEPAAEPRPAAGRPRPGEQPAGEPIRVDDTGGNQPGDTGPELEQPAAVDQRGTAGPGRADQPAEGRDQRTAGGDGGNAQVDQGTRRDSGSGVVEGQPESVSSTIQRPANVDVVSFEARRQALRPDQQTTVRDGVFAEYVGRVPLRVDDPVNHHPSVVVETKALSGVPYPELEPEYEPAPAVMDAYRRGALSLEGQLDPIWAAVQQNDKHHSGMLIADDVGMGKSRTAAGFVIDRLERGKKRILVVTKGNSNVTNLMESEFPGVYNGEVDANGGFIKVNKDSFPARMVRMDGENMPGQYEHPSKRNFVYEPMPDYGDEPVVFFCASHNLGFFARALREVDWDVIVVDEAHEFKNIDTGRGSVWAELHKRAINNNADFLYLTATPAVDISELEYLYGLKIWTVDGFNDWIGVITGQMSPEVAARRADQVKAIGQWIADLGNRLDPEVLKPKSVILDGKKQIVYDLGGGLMVQQHSNYNTIARVNPLGDGFTIEDFISTDNNEVEIAIAIGQQMQKLNPNIGNLSRQDFDRLYARAKFEVTRDMPVAPVDLPAVGMTDATDIARTSGKRKPWGGEDTAFSSTLPPAHTEQIMRELKVGGYYISRDILRNGVEFTTKEYKPPAEALDLHRRRVDLYRRIIRATYKYGRMNKRDKIKSPMAAIQADAKRSLFDMRLPGVIAEAREAIERGEQVVISMVSVSEVEEEAGNLFSAANAINDLQVDGNSREGFTVEGQIPEAVIEKAEILEELREIGGLRSPVEILTEAFPGRIGFVTGSVNEAARQAARKDFQANKLDVIVISGAGKTGINLHDVTGKRRVHLIVGDYEWSATQFKQELGRVDRTGQKTSPKVTVLHMGNPGEVKFLATITNRMKGLGATSKGSEESAGTSALNAQFEMGGEADKEAVAITWQMLSNAQKDLFLDRYFKDIPQGAAGNNYENWKPKTAIPKTAQSIKKFTMALQSMQLEDANDVMRIYMEVRDSLSGEAEAMRLYRAERETGEIARKTQLAENLVMNEVVSNAGHKFGILSGVLTPHMNRIAQLIGAREGDQWRQWLNFQNPDTLERVSGLEIKPSWIERIAKHYGQSLGLGRTNETVLRDLKLGDRVPVRGVNGAPWVIYMGKGGFREGLIILDGRRLMQVRNDLLNNGAAYSARGSFWFVPEERLQDFLKRFPLRDDDPGLAQTMPAGRTYAFGPSGQRYNFAYRVVSLDDLIQSHLDTFDLNPRYPRELQPRNRDRAAYREQVYQIAQNLDERALIDTHLVDSGTPIIGPDLVVENGNGRVMAMRRARADYPDRWQAYQNELRARLTEYGLSESDLRGIKDPVLVRERLDEVDRVQFANEAQASQSMQLTVDELATTDAKYVDDAMLANLTIGAEQSIAGALKSAANRDLVNAFLNKLPVGEKSAFLDPEGNLSLDGLTRLRNAIFAYVFPGEAGKRLADAFLISQSESVSNIRAAIFDTLGIMSQAEGLIRRGQRDASLSITDDLARAVDVYARLRNQGASVSDYIKQMALFGDELTPFQMELLGYIHNNNRSRKRLRELLALYADNVINVQQDPNQMALFAGATSTKGEILDSAAQQLGQDTSFAEVSPGRPQPETPETEIPPAATPETEIPPAATPETEIPPAATPQPEIPPAAEPETQTPEPVQAVHAPLGTAAQYSEPPLEEAALEGWMKEIGPILDRAEAAMLDPNSRRYGVMDLDRDLDPQTKKQLRRYLGQVYADMTDAKLGMIRYGENRRDAALLNYNQRTGFDNVLGTVMPYEFWYTRSMLNWGLRALARPSILANWARLRNLNERMTEDDDNYPTRLKKKTGIRVPWLPDWMGGQIYIDPLRQLFPFEQMMRPWEALAEQKNMEIKKAETALAQMVEDEEIDELTAWQARQMRAGPIWEKALARARGELDREINNPLDFAFMMSGPSLPISIAYHYATGNPDKISHLPITRLIQANTAAMGIGGPRGVNIEAPLRKTVGLPEVDRYEDYRVDRMLANMAAEGLISTDEALRAMIDREGEAFTAAQQRVSQMGIIQYWGAPLGIDMFPEGERELRALREEYDKARMRWSKGDKNALTEFYDKYPEYEARAASFRDPEERLRRYLISEVWDRYMSLPSLHKQQVREQLGSAFTDAFLDKETRSYDSIRTVTLATWAELMGAINPKAAPDSVQTSLQLAPPEIARSVQAYRDEIDKRFPNIGDTINALYQMPEDQRRLFEQQNPQIDAYYAWRNEYLASHPEIIPWVTSEQSELYGLPQAVQAHVYNYRAQRAKLYPGIDAIQEYYYRQPAGKARREYLKRHPELSEYWTWRRQMAAVYPEAAPYILSEQSMKKAILGDDAPMLTASDLQAFSPQLMYALIANIYSGTEFGAGAWAELESVWEQLGEPAGDLETWLTDVVIPSLKS